MAAWLAKNGRLAPILLKEPTSGPFGRQVRERARQGRNLAAEMEILIKDRAEDVELNIAPALAEGRAVLMDRYILSTAAYQGALPGGDPEAILAANANFPWPDATFLIEVEPSEGLGRVGRRGQIEAAFENAPYLSKVKEVYDRLNPPGLVRLNGMAPPDEVHAKITQVVADLMASF